MVKMIEPELDKPTPEGQAGGMIKNSIREHLMVLSLVMKMNEAASLPTIMTLVDVTLCFDKVRMMDAVFEAALANANSKVHQVLVNLMNETYIKINGNPLLRETIIKAILGQETNFAPKVISLTIGKATDSSIPLSNCIKVRNASVPPREFMDDVKIFNKDTKTARLNGEIMSKTLDNLSLEANPKKSVAIISGCDHVKVRAARKELKDDPIRLHGTPIKNAESEPYLGFSMHMDGLVQSINQTVKLRTARAWFRAVSIKSMVNHPALRNFGWFKVAVVLIQAILPPILAYSAEIWIGCPRYIIDRVEMAFKKMLFSVLEVPEHSKYAAVLMECGFLRMKHYIAKMQLNYVNQIVWEMQGTLVHQIMMEEFSILDERSTLANADEIAKSYNIPPHLLGSY